MYFEICLGFKFCDLEFIWKLEFEIWDLCDYILQKMVTYLSLSSYERTIITG